MKKIVPLILMSTLSLQANAGTMGEVATSPTFFNGPYVGLGLGGTFGIFKTSVAETYSPAPPAIIRVVFNQSGEFKEIAPTFVGTGVLGYGMSINSLYLGAELFGTWGRIKTHSNLSTYADNDILTTANGITNTAAQLNQGEWGIDGRIGFIPTPTTLVYARIGAGFNKMHLNSYTNKNLGSPNLNNGTIFNGSINYDIEKSVTALRVGAGLEQMITDTVSLRGDYIYEDYGTLIGFNAVTAPLFLGLTNGTSVKLESHSVLATLIWHFNF